ncbi:MAG: NAD-binding protein [Alistipes putredinis]|nr:MAG: NAD-binding protein [Alistipes putredinis]
MLSGGMHDITVIDSDPKLLDDISGIADVVTIEGDSTTFSILKKASVRKADLFLAVNQVENINIISAMLAKQPGCEKIHSPHRQQRISGSQQQGDFS